MYIRYILAIHKLHAYTRTFVLAKEVKLGFTCFASTKVRVYAYSLYIGARELPPRGPCLARLLCDLWALLALLVQKYACMHVACIGLPPRGPCLARLL
jgi:hypothetical protein